MPSSVAGRDGSQAGSELDQGWGYRGETPVLLINGRARYGAAVMQVAVNNRGKLVFSIQSKAVDAEDFRDS